MVGIKKIISIFFATIFVLQLSQVIKSTEAGAATYVWTGVSANCLNDGVTVCDFDDADNWVPPAGYPGSPKDATEYFNVAIINSNFNFTILATNPTGYYIDWLMIGYDPFDKRSVEEEKPSESVTKRYVPDSTGVKLTIQGNTNPNIARLYMSQNSKLVLDTVVQIGGQLSDIILLNSVRLEVKKTLTINTNLTSTDSGSYEFVIDEGATFNYLVSNANLLTGLGGNDNSNRWFVAGTVNSHASVCETNNANSWLKLSGHAVINCQETKLVQYLPESGTEANPTVVTIYNQASISRTFIVPENATLNIYEKEGLGSNSGGLVANKGILYVYSNTTFILGENTDVQLKNGGTVEFFTNVEAGYSSGVKKRGGFNRFFVEWGTLYFHQDLTPLNNYGIFMKKENPCQVYFGGNVNGGTVPFDFEILGYVEIQQNYTNAKLESLDGGAIVIGNGYINTDFPTKFVLGSLNINGATFNKGMNLDVVSFFGHGTINGDVNVTNSISYENSLTVDPSQTITINGNLVVDKCNISAYTFATGETGYLVVNGDVTITDSTFKFRFEELPPSSTKVYKLLTYTGTATGIPNNITLPTINGATLVYEHDTTSSPKQVTITFTPPSPPTEPTANPTNGPPTNGPPTNGPPTNGPPGNPSSANKVTIIDAFMVFVLIASIFTLVFF